MVPPTHTVLEALFERGEKLALTSNKAASGGTENLDSCSSALRWTYKTSREAAVKYPKQ